MNRKTTKLFLLVLVVGFVFYYLYNKTVSEKFVSFSEILSTPNLTTISSSPNPIQPTGRDTLKNIIETSLIGTQGTYGIAIKNLKTGESYYSNENRTFLAGSLYKLWIAATVFDQIQKGKVSEDETLSADVSLLNQEFSVPPGSAELTSGQITSSLVDALDESITVSNNYAAMLLAHRVTIPTVASFLIERQLNDSSFGDPKALPQTTPLDIAIFYEKLYKGRLLDKENTDKMLKLLKAQELNDKLPKYFPDGVSIAHKTGEINNSSHDAGIVFGKRGDYIIVALSESDSPPNASERIADLSKAVYQYFEGNY